MTALALRPLTSGETLDASFAVYRRLFVSLVLVQVVCSGLPLVLGLYVESAGGRAVGLRLAWYALSVLLGTLATVATTFLVSEAYLGRSLSAGGALERALPYLGPVLGLSLLVGVVVGLGAIPFLALFMTGIVALTSRADLGFAVASLLVSFPLLVIPASLFAGLAVSTQCLVLEPGRNPMRAMRRSWSLTRGRRLRIVALVLVLGLLLAIPIVGLSALAGIVGVALHGSQAAARRDSFEVLAVSAVGQLVTLVITPVFYCLLVLIYYDLRVRKEGFDLEVLATSLAGA